MIGGTLLGIGITLILYGIYKWMTINHNYFVTQNIPYLKPFLCFGSTFGFFCRKYSPLDFVEMLYKKFPNEKIFGLFDLRSPLYFVRDPEMIKQMAVKDFDHFEDHRSFIDDSVDKLFGNSLFMLRGEKWRDMRATLSPAFTGSKMRQMFELILECADDMSNYFVEIVSKTSIKTMNCEMKEAFGRYTNDVIATSAFGIKINSFQEQENEFFLIGKNFLDFNKPITSIKLLFMKALPKLMLYLDIELTSKKVSNFFRKMVFDTMKIRNENGIFRPDLINLLMQVRSGNIQQNHEDDRGATTIDGFATVEESSIGKRIVKRIWNDDEIIAQCFLFFAAGFDTTSSALSFVMYELALNPIVQDKLYREINEANKQLMGKKLKYDSLQKLQYLDMVVTETLRLWPPAAFTDRMCVKDYQYDDGIRKIVIPKGVSFWLPIYSIHRDENYFPNPDKFDPERFNEDNKNNILPGTYMPFGVGPRNCIGSRFALMEIKAVLYCLLMNFKFQPNDNTQIPIQFKKSPFSLATERGVELDLVLRSKE